MIPFDGSGYGVSMYWRNEMKHIAKKNEESCFCWEQQEPLIKFNEGDNVTMSIECAEKTSECTKSFRKTEIQFICQFKEFYKV